MKKLFSFRSSASSNGNKNSTDGSLTDKQVYWENPPENGKGKSQNPTSENQSTFSLRRSRSFSSAAFLDGGSAQQTFPCASDQSSCHSRSSSSVQAQQYNRSSRRTLTPERHRKTKRLEAVALQSDEQPDCSGSSSVSSGNASNKVVDRYIDGEQQHEGSRLKSRTSLYRTGNCGPKLPPRINAIAPASPTGSAKDKPRSHSFRGTKGAVPYVSSRLHDSPRQLAKHVVEKLCQSHISSSPSSNDHATDVPITIGDVYSRSLNKDDILSEETYLSFNQHQAEDCLVFEKNHDDGFFEKNHDDGFFEKNHDDGFNSTETRDEIGMQLESKLKEAEDKFQFLSEELEQERFLGDLEFNIPALVQKIRELTEDKASLALNVFTSLRNHIEVRASMKEELQSAKEELEAWTRKLQKEKDEMQSALEKELDRRSVDWSQKVEKYQLEEQRLRERVRELAEQNVALQREVSSFNETESERRNTMTIYERQIREMAAMLEVVREENRNMRQNFCELQEKYKEAEEGRDCIRRNFEEKEEECKELHVSITRLQRTCSEQQKTIDGLQGELTEAGENKRPLGNSEKHMQKLQMEHIRLTGIEQTLRREIKSYKVEADTLRRENIYLLDRLKEFGKEGNFLTFKLDQEIQTRVNCLQKQGLLLLNESVCLSSKLLEFIKRRTSEGVQSRDNVEVQRNGLDTHFIIESDTRVQGFKRGTENLLRSLDAISNIVHEKSNIASESDKEVDKSGQPNVPNRQDLTRSELKAETLLTSLLRETLFTKDLEGEQLQAELATAVRGNDILRSEVQNALDSLSCVNHKMKELELQMIKKDEKINQLQIDLQECTKELAIAKGILPKVTQERDMMWEEVKQYTEKNMLLNSEVNLLKKKIEALDEDILLKEGQITILKDTLGSKSFDLLSSLDQDHEFQWGR